MYKHIFCDILCYMEILAVSFKSKHTKNILKLAILCHFNTGAILFLWTVENDVMLDMQHYYMSHNFIGRVWISSLFSRQQHKQTN